MTSYVVDLRKVAEPRLDVLGGKGAGLARLSRVDGIRVPPGFCVTTDAYAEVVASDRELGSLLAELASLGGDDADSLRRVCSRIRQLIESLPMPPAVAAAIDDQLEELGADAAYAVRSSATAEDLPTASFAGQQDTYLNVVGAAAVLEHVSRCWASLFTDRAVTYRIQHGVDHRTVRLAVIVQEMVPAEAAGIMFTADPITSSRMITSIDAGFGLGEALVSGLATADNYRVRDGAIIDKRVATQDLAVQARREGGTEQQRLTTDRGSRQALTDEQILRLDRIGRTIEAELGRPQDIEWALAAGTFFILQARPITTLFPIPGIQDGKNHVYMSFGHQQMMTDAMKPFGLSFFQVISVDAELLAAGGRLYIDLSADLASPVGRRIVLASMGRIDPLMLDAIKTLTRRKGFVEGLPRGGTRFFKMGTGYFTWKLPVEFVRAYRDNDPEIVDELMARDAVALDRAAEQIRGLQGDRLFAFVLEDLERLMGAIYGQSIALIWVGMYALSWVNKKLEKWLGEKGAGDALARSVTNNVTSNMGLALLDVADSVRRYPAVVSALRTVDDENFFETLSGLEGGEEACRSIRAFLDRYGVRCPGEIDITRPRWNERPSQLVPLILNEINTFEAGAHRILFEDRARAAQDQQRELLARLERRRGGKRKAARTRKMISRMLNFAGFREYPKYLMMQHYWMIKQALLGQAATLQQDGVIETAEDVFYLTFDEFRELVGSRRLDRGLVERRRRDFESVEPLTPPRMITSDGEVITGEYGARGVPAGALVGIPASSGTVEGRARIVRSLQDAVLSEGDILVTAFTDPSWTPAFLSVKGLVTEVGGTMTHGSVVAREYGLPAVVGVEGATRLIRDGQSIRVNGSQGYVELLG